MTLLPGLAAIDDIGRDPRGGWSRHVFDDAELALREWFTAEAERVGLRVEQDRNTNLWAWWGQPGPDAVVTGSHLDSVPGGGAFDGPLGIVSALEAVNRLRRSGHRPRRPVAIVAFAEEEGSRFGIACLGSRLLTGAIDPDRARALTDPAGTSFADAAAHAGIDIRHLGRDAEALSRIGVFIELHVEQGRGLIDLDRPVALASSILAHGRWRLSFRGQGNHAGTTLMSDRRDPLVAAARAIHAVRDTALGHPGARATIGRLQVVPGGTNVIASAVTSWLDARAGNDEETLDLVRRITAAAQEQARAEGVEVEVVQESWSGETVFDAALADDLRRALGDVPTLATGAGHDAGILAGHAPTAMLFVRNPTGISHSPEEHADYADTVLGVTALEKVVRSLT